MNWDELENEVVETAAGVFTELQQAHPDEHFYAFALYSDSDGITICPAANSREALARKFESDEVDPDDEDAAYYTWATAEWAYEFWQADRFNAICATLRDEAARSKAEPFQSQVFLTMTRALARLREQGIFRQTGAAGPPTLFVTLSDDDRAETIENQSAKVLNDPAVFTRFANRYGDAQ